MGIVGTHLHRSPAVVVLESSQAMLHSASVALYMLSLQRSVVTWVYLLLTY